MRPQRDDLTSREREVLGLIRVGRTNEEIAQRLDISLAGAKYHVSQILSKLGVSSREEAVAVATEGQRRWWLAAPLWAKIAGAATVVAAAGGLALLVWGVLRTGGSSDLQELTVNEIYSRTLASASKPNLVLHTTITYPEVTVEQGSKAGEKLTPTLEMWIDGAADAARTHSTGISEGEADESEDLVVGEYIYYIHQPINPGDELYADRHDFEQRCAGSDRAVIALLFTCYGESPATRIQAGEFEGREAVALVISASFGPEVPEFETTIYLDPTTWLPIASVTQGFSPFGSGNPTVARYQHEFLDRDALAADFFDPQAVDYGPGEDELLDAMALRAPVYWLGRELNLPPGATCFSTGECSLALRHVSLGGSTGVSSQSAGQLQYTSPSENLPVSLVLWEPQAWEKNLADVQQNLFMDDRCFERTEVPVSGRRLVVYTFPLFDAPPEADCRVRVGGGPEAPTETFAYVELEEIVVELRPNRSGGPDTIEDLRIMVEHLERR